MQCDEDTQESDDFEEPTLSSDDGIYTTESTSSSEGSFTDHSEEFDYDEEKKEYSVQDWPDDVWGEHYDKIRHLQQDTCYDMDDGQPLRWHITGMPGMALNADPIVVAHIQACHENQKFTYGDEQYTSAKDVVGASEKYERRDRRLRTTFSIASKHFHGVPPGIRTSTNPRIYVSAMQFGNLNHVPELEATVILSPGMLAYVEGDGWCIVQNITAYNDGDKR